MTTPFGSSAAVLDAAGHGATVPGYEAIGGLLLDLACTVPVAPGEALASSEVAAACAATAPGRLATLAGHARPTTIVVSLAAALVAGLVLAPAAQPDVGTRDPDGSGVARVVSVPGPEPRDPLPVGVAADVPVDVLVDGGPPAPIPGSDAAGRSTEAAGRADPARSDPGGSAAPVVSTSGPSTSGPPTTADPGTSPSPSTLPTSSPSTSSPSTSSPTTSSPSPSSPTTSSPSTTTVAPQGNNGNENGNGVGNGKGNQGRGNPGDRGNGGGPPA